MGLGAPASPTDPFAMEGAGRTLAILTELDLHGVETTNIDQSQSVVITVAVVHGETPV